MHNSQQPNQFSRTTISAPTTNNPNIDQFDKFVKPIVGVLRCNWRNAEGDVSTFTFGTATLLSPRVVLTCSHNIFSEFRSRRCDEAIFIPKANGCLMEHRHYSNQKHGFKNIQPLESFKVKPVTEQLALVVLSQPFQTDQQVNYPFLGSIDIGQMENTSVFIAGYPSQYYHRSLSLATAFAYSKPLEGKVHSIEDGYIINHDMKTSVGFSGGAIFAKSPNSDAYFICGIHTHRGMKPEYNSGLYFNWEILNRIEQYFSQINKQHSLSEQLKLIYSRQYLGYNEYQYEDDGMEEGNNSEISMYDELLANQFDSQQTNQSTLCD